MIRVIDNLRNGNDVNVCDHISLNSLGETIINTILCKG